MLNTFIQKFATPFILSAMFLIALFSFREYGMAWDENAQRALGLVTWNHLAYGDNNLLSTPDSEYGVSFELLLILIEKAFNLTDIRSVFLMRHLVSHLFFLLGAFFCYKLIELLYQNKLLSLLGLLLYLLHPHLYAHSFFNTKDLPFLSMCTICFYLCVKLFREKNFKNVIFLGVALGLLVNIRLMGILLFCSVFLILFLDALREKNWIFHLKMASVLAIVSALTLYLSWPYLWTAPFHHFYLAFKSMSHYDWPMKNLFNGELIPATETRWTYMPVWFCITTPISYLVVGFAGVLCFTYLFLKQPLEFIKTLSGKANLLFMICFFVPVLAVIILKSVVYDGWRHLFFIYPSLVMLAVFALHQLTSYKNIVLAVFFASILWTGGFMILNAPFQHTYFNAFVNSDKPEDLRKKYDMDYWGTSYLKSLQYILEKDSAKFIKVCAANDAAEYNIKLIPQNQRYRIVFTPFEEADYFISNYRWHPEDYPFEDKKVFSVKVENATINAVFKLK